MTNFGRHHWRRNTVTAACLVIVLNAPVIAYSQELVPDLETSINSARLSTSVHDYDCIPLNMQEVITFPTDRTDVKLPVACDVSYSIDANGNTDVLSVACSDKSWEAHLEKTVSNLRWTTSTKGFSCRRVGDVLTMPFEFVYE